MNSQAKAFFKKKNYQAALATYHQAVEYCGIYELSEEMAAIYGNCAHIYLKIDKIPEAFKYSILSIERCKGYAKVWWVWPALWWVWFALWWVWFAF